jgi:hypothetical protein
MSVIEIYEADPTAYEQTRIIDVRLWHKADMLNALTNVRFWSKPDIDQPLLTKDGR